MIDGGEHLWRCLRYIDLNMVRARVVGHPEEWDWCGYRELLELKKRNRLIDRAELMKALGEGVATEQFCLHYEMGIAEAIERKELERQAGWTESGRRSTLIC